MDHESLSIVETVDDIIAEHNIGSSHGSIDRFFPGEVVPAVS